MGKIVGFVRHAKAMEGAFDDDRTRPLSPEGKAIHEKVTEKLLSTGLKPDRIYHSPYLRAKETAEIMARAFSDVKIASLEALGADFDADVLLEIMRKPGENVMLFVGHDPSLSSLGRRLANAPCLPAGLPKSHLLLLTFEEEVDWKQGAILDFFGP